MQIPVQAFPAGSRADRKSPPPLARSRPPDHQAGQAKGRRQSAANRVGRHAVRTEQQIAVQVAQPSKQAEPAGDGGAVVFARVGIDQAFDLIATEKPAAEKLAPARERHRGRLLPVPARFHFTHHVTGMRGLDDLRELRASQRLPGHGYFQFFRQDFVHIIAENEGAAADAYHGDVQAERQSGPQMDLEHGSAQPGSLRPPQPAAYEGHAISHLLRIAWGSSMRRRAMLTETGRLGGAAPDNAARDPATRRARRAGAADSP